MTITTPGTVIDSKEIIGCVQIRANNVTIRRSVVRVTADCANGMAIDTGDENRFTGTLIEDVEIDGGNFSPDGAGIGYAGFTARRVNIHNTGSGLRLGRGGTSTLNMTAVIEDSYIHDLFTAGTSHNAGSGGFSSRWVRITHNNIECLDFTHCTDAAGWLTDENGGSWNLTVEKTRFAGGGYAVYAGMYCNNGQFHDIVWRDNVFAGSPPRGLSEYGPVTATNCLGQFGNVWMNNLWESGQLVIP
jgi:hypothetical protein